jgi:hypothetical protein
MQFIETTDGHIARSRVVRITADEETGDERVEYIDSAGKPRTARLESTLHAALGDTVIPAEGGFRVVRVRFADASGPALVSVAPVVAWRVSHDGAAVEPLTPYVADLDARRPDCGLEGTTWPGVIAHGESYPTLALFIEHRRDALRAASQARAEGARVAEESRSRSRSRAETEPTRPASAADSSRAEPRESRRLGSARPVLGPVSNLHGEPGEPGEASAVRP